MNNVDEDADLTYRFWRVLRTVYKVWCCDWQIALLLTNGR